MTNNTMQPQEEGEEKLEDILKSIRNLIEDREHQAPEPDSQKERELSESADQILELTEVASVNSNFTDIENKKEKLLSEEASKKTAYSVQSFSEKLKENHYLQEKSAEDIVYDLMKPMMKEWLNNNLPKVVEKIVTEEIRRLVPKQ